MLEFFHHHLALHLQALGAEAQGEHPVAFQPEAGLYVLFGKRKIVIGQIVVRPGVALAARILDRLLFLKSEKSKLKKMTQ